MSTPVTLSSFMLAAAISASTPLLAQDRTVISGAELDAAVVAQPRGNREAVRELLGSPDGQRVAGRFGLSAAEVSSRVGALDQATVDLLAERAVAGNRVLAGGADTIVVSTTAIIIALLLIILLAK